MNDDCIFCKIANGKIPVDVLYQNTNAVLISDKNPIAPNHLLVIPKDHFDSLSDLQDKEGPLDVAAILLDMFELVDEYTSSTSLESEGYRVVINTGTHAGQTVKHLHAHLLGGATLKNDFGA